MTIELTERGATALQSVDDIGMCSIHNTHAVPGSDCVRGSWATTWHGLLPLLWFVYFRMSHITIGGTDHL